MLRIYADVIAALGEMRPVMKEVELADGDLARQLRRAGASVPLNLAEGCSGHGRNRALRYSTALGSAREVVACLDVARTLYEIEVGEGVRDTLDRICATLNKLSR